MGVTVDVIPRLPGESSEAAIARIYDGGMEIVLDVGALTSSVEEIVSDVEPAPEAAFDEWRAEVLRRLYELFPDWCSEEEEGLPILWAPGCEWQVEFISDGITLRARRCDAREPGPGQADLFGAFVGLRTTVHWPDGGYADLDAPDGVGPDVG